jgi:regulator of sigma E protease
MITAIVLIVIFYVFLIVHEYGHYAMARRAGMRVTSFTIGMGPLLWQFTYQNTVFTFRMLPLLGYVSLPDMEKHPRSEQIKMLLAGSAINIVMGAVLMGLSVIPTMGILWGIVQVPLAIVVAVLLPIAMPVMIAFSILSG